MQRIGRVVRSAQRHGKVPTKFELILNVHWCSLQPLDYAEWIPDDKVFLVTWTRGSHLASTQECKYSSGVAPGRVTFEQELRMKSTLYKRHDSARFEDKKYKLSIAQVSHGKTRLISCAYVNFAAYVEMSHHGPDIHPMDPISKVVSGEIAISLSWNQIDSGDSDEMPHEKEDLSLSATSPALPVSSATTDDELGASPEPEVKAGGLSASFFPWRRKSMVLNSASGDLSLPTARSNSLSSSLLPPVVPKKSRNIDGSHSSSGSSFYDHPAEAELKADPTPPAVAPPVASKSMAFVALCLSASFDIIAAAFFAPFYLYILVAQALVLIDVDKESSQAVEYLLWFPKWFCTTAGVTMLVAFYLLPLFSLVWETTYDGEGVLVGTFALFSLVMLARGCGLHLAPVPASPVMRYLPGIRLRLFLRRLVGHQGDTVALASLLYAASVASSVVQQAANGAFDGSLFADVLREGSEYFYAWAFTVFFSAVLLRRDAEDKSAAAAGGEATVMMEAVKAVVGDAVWSAVGPLLSASIDMAADLFLTVFGALTTALAAVVHAASFASSVAHPLASGISRVFAWLGETALRRQQQAS